MAKTDRMTLRLPDDVKAALAQAAAEDMRSVSAMAEKIITEWLRANGRLRADKFMTQAGDLVPVKE